MNIWFATNNAHKKEELEAILGRQLKIPADEGYNFNPDETGSTFCENALIKARELKKLTGLNDLVIADDSGLCVDALNGRPGVLSARYGACEDKTSIVKPASRQQNIMLLDELGGSAARSARFICAMVLMADNGRFVVVQETIEGEIVKKDGMKGAGGFGYDPVFYIREYGCTLAQLSQEEKNKISHRAKAGKLIASLLNNY